MSDEMDMEDADGGSSFYTYAGLAVLAIGGFLLWKRSRGSRPMPVFLPRTHVGHVGSQNPQWSEVPSGPWE